MVTLEELPFELLAQIFRELGSKASYWLRSRELKMLAIMTPSFTPAAQEVLNEDVRLWWDGQAQIWWERRNAGANFVVKRMELCDLSSGMVEKVLTDCPAGIQSLSIYRSQGISSAVLGGANLRSSLLFLFVLQSHADSVSLGLAHFELSDASFIASAAPLVIHFHLKSWRIGPSTIACVQEILTASADTLVTLELLLPDTTVLTAIVVNIHLVQSSLRTLKISSPINALALHYSDILAGCHHLTVLGITGRISVDHVREMLTGFLPSATVQTLVLRTFLVLDHLNHAYDSLLALPELVNVKILRFQGELNGWEARWGNEAELLRYYKAKGLFVHYGPE